MKTWNLLIAANCRELPRSWRIGALSLVFFAPAFAQEKHSEYQVIPVTNGSATGIVKWLEKPANGTNYVGIKGPDALTTSYSMTLPSTIGDGFLYFDSGTGLLSFTGAGTCGVDCMTLTTNQTAAGIKTFQNGLILENNTYVNNGGSIQLKGSIGVVQTHGGETSHWLTAGGKERVYISNSGTGDSTKGLVYTYTGALGAETLFNQMNGSGFDTAGEYRVGGTQIVDSGRNATFVGLTIPTGAVNNYVWTSDAAGVGSWQPGAAGGSYITTNTTQTGLTGDKSTAGLWTFTNHIRNGTANTFDFGTSASPWRVAYQQTTSTEFLEIVDSSRTDLWRLNYGSSLKTLDLYSGAGSQKELAVQVIGSTQSLWGFRGTLYPLNTSGSNGDVGLIGTPFRAGYITTMNSTTYNGQDVVLTTTGSIAIGVRAFMSGTTLQLKDSGGTITKILLTAGGAGAGIIRTFDNAGSFQNAMDGSGFLTNVGYAVGPFGSGTTVIDNLGNATFATIKMTTAPSAGYLMTSDASGNATWQAPAGGSFVTTNTNQSGLTGTKAWTNLHTFNGGVEVKLLSTARHWYPETDDAYDLGCCSVSFNQRWKNAYISTQIIMGVYSGLRSEITPGSEILYNSTGAKRVQLVQPGSSSTAVGIIQTLTGAAGVETIVNRIDSLGVLSSIGFAIGSFGAGTTVIDSSRNASLANVNYSGTLAGVSALITTLIATTGTITNMTSTNPVLGSSSTTGYCWTATNAFGSGSWQACGTGSFITTNSAQTGLTGTKQINAGNAWTWGGASAERWEVGSTSLTHYNASNIRRVQLTNTGASSSSVGSILSFTDASGSTIWAGFNASGYWANGTAGAGASTGTTLTVRNSAGSGTCTITISLGIVTSSTC